MNKAKAIVELLSLGLGEQGYKLAILTYPEDKAMIDLLYSKEEKVADESSFEGDNYQLLFCDKGVWMCLTPMQHSLAHAWGRALEKAHKVFLRKGKDLFYLKGTMLPIKDACTLLCERLLHKPVYVSEELNDWVLRDNPIVFLEKKRVFKKVITFPPKVWPVDAHTQDVAALATKNLPEALYTEYNAYGKEIKGLRARMPVKKHHVLPTHKSKGHNGTGWDSPPKFRYKSMCNYFVSQHSLEAGEEVEEDKKTFRVFTHSHTRYEYWLSVGKKHGLIRSGRPNAHSVFGRYRVSFYKPGCQPNT